MRYLRPLRSYSITLLCLSTAIAQTSGPPQVVVGTQAVSAPVGSIDTKILAPTPSNIPVRRFGTAPIKPNLPSQVTDPLVRAAPAPLVNTSPGLNFDGLGQGVYGFAVRAVPPDPDGAIGATQYVQWINTSFAVFDKNTGALIKGPVAGNQLFASLPNSCAGNNDGDPIVLYDKLANRWLFSQFSITGGPPYLQCIAVSKTSDATGAFNVYSFPTPFINDYTKFGVWPDGYYSSSNMFDASDVFQGARVCAFDRAAMLNGAPATAQCFLTGLNYGGLLPSDVDGTTPPPQGSPNLFLNYGTNSLNLWKFHADFVNPNNSSFSGPVNLPVAPFFEACSGGTCIPQLGTSQQLDSLGDRLMFRLAYRNFGDHEALVANHSVSSGAVTGVRWYELRSPNSSPFIYQQGTVAPDSNFRWEGSIAMDHVGNIALGYSVSSAAINPGIRYTGRAPGDPLGTMQAESSIIAGSASQTNTSRWGDYTAMTVDPVDDCTFWYTNEYYITAGSHWNTRIASFRFPSCSPAPPPAGTPLVSGFSLNSQRNNYSGFVGMKFTVGSSALSVTALGRVYIAGNTAAHIVKLVRASDSSDVQGAAVTVPLPAGTAGQFAYAQLASPVTLPANTSYYLVSQETASGDFWYDYTPLTPATGVTVNGPVYATSPSSYFLVPGSANYSYVPVGLLFTTSSVIPPVVAITAPAAGATVSGKALAVAAAATAAPGLTIASVQFKVDGTLAVGQSVPAAPFQTTLDTTTLSDGSHTLTAIATDSTGVQAASAPVAINVGNGGAPATGTEFISSVTFYSLRNNYTGWVGMQFNTGGQSVTVSALGRMYVAGNTNLHTVKLVNASTAADVPNGAVTLNMAGGTASKFKYANLPAPITLPAGSSYYLVSQEISGGDHWYDVGPVTPTNVATISGGIYSAGSSYFLVASPNVSYVPVSFLYGGSGAVSSPPVVIITAPIAGAAVSGNSVTVTATAQASAGLSIASLQFKVDGAMFTPPLDSTKLTNGSHALTAVAVDSAGASGTSAPVSINVSNSVPPPSQPAFIAGQSLATLRNNFSGYVGMQFTVGNSPLTVTQLGRLCAAGNSQTHNVKLVLAGTSADVAGGAVPVSMAGCTPGQYQYAALSAPITLSAQTAYHVVSQETTQGDQWYDYSLVTPAAGAGIVNGPIYLSGAYVLVPSPGYSYVPVNFRYNASAGAPPSVAIVVPAANVQVSGQLTVTATATAATALTIANVQFKVNGNNVGAPITGSGPSYSLQIDTTALSNGINQLSAVATDSAGASSSSTPVPVNVVNSGGPPPAGNPLITSQVGGTLRNNFSGLVGMRFTTASAALTVTSLGRICVAGNIATHLVKVATANGTDLAGGSVSVAMTGCTPGTYQYATLPAAIQLSANTTYHLVSQETAGGDQWYDYAPVTSTPVAVVNGPVYFAGGYFLVTSPGYSYVPLNLRYQ